MSRRWREYKTIKFVVLFRPFAHVQKAKALARAVNFRWGGRHRWAWMWVAASLGGVYVLYATSDAIRPAAAPAELASLRTGPYHHPHVYMMAWIAWSYGQQPTSALLGTVGSHSKSTPGWLRTRSSDRIESPSNWSVVGWSSVACANH